MVVADTYENRLIVGLNNGRGLFSALPSVSVGQRPAGQIVVSDLDADGDRDVVVANWDGGGSRGSVSVLFNLGGGVLGAPANIPDYPGASSLAAGDLNGDGRLDLVVASNAARPPLLGNGDGTFTPVTQTLSLFGVAPAVLDVNADGLLDLIHLGLLRLGNGDGTFAPPTSTGLSSNSLWHAGGDFDGDGYVDLVGVDRLPTVALPIRIVRGNGDGTFQAPVAYAGDRLPWAVGYRRP